MNKIVAVKACKSCKRLVSEKICPGCGGRELTSDFEGYLFIIDASKSVFAQIIHASLKGEYALRVSK